VNQQLLQFGHIVDKTPDQRVQLLDALAVGRNFSSGSRVRDG